MKKAVNERGIEGIADLLRQQKDILFATVFGSVASDRARFESDLDIAVLAARPLLPQRKQELTEMLASVAGRPVDLVDLRTSGVVVSREALGGKRLFCKDDRAYGELLSRLVTDAEDFLPYRNRMLRQRRHAWIR